MPLFSFLVSTMALWVVARKRDIPLLSPYGIFVAFQALYNLVPALVSRLDVPSLTLLADTKTADTQMWLATSANVCFGIVFWLFYRKPAILPRSSSSQEHKRRNYLLWSLVFFFITCVVSVKYGWNAQAYAMSDLGGQPAGGVYVLASYVKSAFVAVYLYYIYRFGLDRWAWLLLGCHAIVAFLDGARTTFLPILLLTLFLFQGQSRDIKRKRSVYLVAVVGIVISIGARAVIIRDDSALAKMTTPVTVEGIMGSYPSLQSIYALKQEHHPNLTFGASYIVDPVAWFLPQGESRNKYLFLQSWVKDSSAWLQEDFAPMGGFYYIGESVAAFSYFGPALVTTLFAFSLIWIERNAHRYRLLYLTWTPTVGILFVKMIFGNAIKLFVVYFVLVGFLVLIHRVRMFLGRSMNRARMLSGSQLLSLEES